MKQKEFKHGFIITYFDSNEHSESVLEALIDVMRLEDYYLVLSSHSPVPQRIQEKCDFFIYEKLNAVDERQYSHGIAELSLIHKALIHLRSCNISWTYKVAYDVVITKPRKFDEWIKDYNYKMVVSKWGKEDMSTHSFFGSIDFMLTSLPFYDTFDEMLRTSNVVEMAWDMHLKKNNLKSEVFVYNSAEDMYGENKFNVSYYEYGSLDFSYNPDEIKYYITNRLGKDIKGELTIFDYYTELPIVYYKEFAMGNGMTYWILPPAHHYVPRAQNGFYLTYVIDGRTYRRNIGIKDYLFKHPLSKRWGSIKYNATFFNNFCDFDNYYDYRDLNIDVPAIKTCLDIGANYGLFSFPLIMQNSKIWMVEADPSNAASIQKMYSTLENVEIIPYAVYDTDGEITFYQDDVTVISSVNEMYSQSKQSRKKITVKSITPNTLIDPLGEIDLMKIDIEGAEYVFFDKVSDSNLKKFKSIIIEFHMNTDFQVVQILKKLAKCGFNYKFYVWGDYRDKNPLKNEMGILYAKRI